MNLRDRMSSGSPTSKPTETENSPMPSSNGTTQNSNLPPQGSLVQEQSEMIQQLQTELNSATEELDSIKKNGRPQDTEKIQTLLSEKSKLTSTIADLRAELSSVQKINQSLTMNNQSLVKQNDDLRNNSGLLSKKEQKQLEERCRILSDGNSELKRQVNISNVEAVEAAQAAQKAAKWKAAKDISDYKKEADKQVSDALKEKNASIREAKNTVKAAKKSQRIAWGSLLVTLLCCLIVHPTFSRDVWHFISVPAVWAWDRLNNYVAWLEKPYYTEAVMDVEQQVEFSTGWAWILRILTVILIIACIVAVIYGIYRLILYYKKRWCNLSLKVLLMSIAVIIVFGEVIKTHIGINLVLLLLIVQILYLVVLAYLDGYYDSRNRTDDWKRIQNA